MVARAIIICLLAAPAPGFAQDATPYTGAGLLRGSVGISPGFLLAEPTTSIHLNGRLEYFVEDRLSFRGELFHYMSSERGWTFHQNDLLSFGPSFHWIKGRVDLNAGIQPGLTFMPYNDRDGAGRVQVSPNLSGTVGLCYAVWDHFHFFVDARYVAGRYQSVLTDIYVSEVIVGGGLGWQFRAKK